MKEKRERARKRRKGKEKEREREKRDRETYFRLFWAVLKCPLQVKLCGDQLIHMLGIICRSGLQGRASSSNLIEEEEVDFDQHLHRRRRRGVSSRQTSDHLEEKGLMREGLGFSHRRRRRDIGLSTTCCMSSCTLRQLRLACWTTKPTRRSLATEPTWTFLQSTGYYTQSKNHIVIVHIEAIVDFPETGGITTFSPVFNLLRPLFTFMSIVV